jgi:hypothetical protein
LLRLPLSLLRLPLSLLRLPLSLFRLGSLGVLGVLGAGALGGGAGGGELGCTLGGLAGSGRVISGLTSWALAIAADAQISAAKVIDKAPTLIF